MDRTGVEESNNRNNNLNTNIVTAGGNTSTALVMTDKPPNTITNVERFVSIDTNPKNMEEFSNPDDLNPATRTTVNNINYSDHPDSRQRHPKPTNYAAKKSIAQGMIDLALITSNANQLKNLIEHQNDYSTFYFTLMLIVVSLLLQISVGVVLIFMGRYNSKGKDKAAAARVNNWVMSAVFMITVINVFIAVFSTSSPNFGTSSTPPIPTPTLPPQT